eukprot:GAHX01002453.1.p1 GENE.GAHX01002453.1~~GAHX01002453.1.p1  ORF type:complete len:405 (+),score=77.00 GAHX01002453.1:742-1956(+)
MTQILSSLKFNEDKKNFDEILLEIDKMQYQTTNGLIEFVNVLTKNEKEEIFSKEMAFRENYTSKFILELLNLNTLSNDEVDKQILYLEHRLETIANNQIEDYIYMARRFISTLFKGINDILKSIKNDKVVTEETINNKNALEELKGYITLQCTDSHQIIKEYIIEHFNRKWKEIKPQEIDIFSMKNVKKDKIGIEPMFYLNLNYFGASIGKSGSYSFSLQTKDYDIGDYRNIKAVIKLFMFTVGNLSFLIPQKENCNGNHTDSHCYFEGYSYKDDEENKVSLTEKQKNYLLVSETVDGQETLFPLHYSDSYESSTDMALSYYLRYKDELFGSKFINPEPVEINLLTLNNATKFQHLIHSLRNKEPQLNHSSLFKRIRKFNGIGGTNIIRTGAYFMNGNVLCELE